MDDDGYPDEEELQAIREWDHHNLVGLFNYIRDLWRWPQYFTIGERVIECSTGGWSGNESLIGALKENSIAWMLTWQKIERGGHYTFELPSFSIKPEQVA